MAIYSKILLITVLSVLVSCSSEQTIDSNVNERIKNFHKKKSDIFIEPRNLNEFAVTQRQFDINWLYDDVGKEYSKYTSKLRENQFTKDELYKLLKRAYIPHDEEFRYTHKRAAIYALSASLYREANTNPYNENIIEFRNIMYNPEFVSILSKENLKVIETLPINLSNYYSLVYRAIKQDPRAFNLLTMQIKTDPKVLNYLFYKINKNYTHKYQKMAIQYATYDQAKDYLSRNGLLLEFVNKDFQDNSILVYTAILQNEKAITFASPRLRRIVETSGAEKLIGLSAKLYIIKDEFSQKTSDIWYFSKNKSVEIVDNISASTSKMYQKARYYIFDEEIEDSFIDEELQLEELVSSSKMIPFTNDKSIVTNVKTLIEVESLKKRPLRNLWRIAKINRQQEIYIAYYQPQGKRYLSSIIYRNGDKYIVSDYKATIKDNGSTIWRYLDYGKFNPEMIKIVDIEETKAKTIRVKFKWVGNDQSSLYLLSEKNEKFVKEFINYIDNIK